MTHLTRRPLAALIAVGLAVASVAIAATPASAATTTLKPTSVSPAAPSGQSVTGLQTKDMTGTADDPWANYIEFDTTASGYSGVRTYATTAAKSTVTGVSVTANWRGPASGQQVWTWAIYNYDTAKWVTLGTNVNSSAWTWRAYTFTAPGTASSYVSTSGALQVRLSTPNGVDNSLLDYEAVTLTTTAPDTAAPSQPTGLTSRSKTSSSVNLAWTASTDNVGVTGYDVYRNNVVVKTVTTNSATDTGLTANTAYQYKVVAKDAAGIASPASSVITVTTSAASTGTYTLPTAVWKFDYQLGGGYAPADGVKMVVRDRTDTEPLAGLYGVCYINLFQTEPLDASVVGSTQWWITNHPNVMLKSGSSVLYDKGWPDEALFDTRTQAQRDELFAVFKGWIDKCATDGFKAVEADNLDSFDRPVVKANGAAATNPMAGNSAGNLAFLKMAVDEAHAVGLAFAQKNSSALSTQAKAQGTNFAIVEDCGAWPNEAGTALECDSYYQAYRVGTTNTALVYDVEYIDNPDASGGFAAACSAWTGRISIIEREEDVLKNGHYLSCSGN